MENPTLDFLLYLIRKCVDQCDIDPDRISVTELINMISQAEMPVGL
ncbi:MAG: hypothetical protein PHP28_02515 [Actinomycetota bacterium]|nr:hypothetical protein [Actinomycetota bacterium]MDD5666343.1 hypothetical protein [Actinomycetota bacterium]